MEDELVLCKAMLKAKEAFDKYLDKQGLDESYFSLYLTGYVLTTNFEKLKEIRMSLSSTGNEKFEYPDKETKNENVHTY